MKTTLLSALLLIILRLWMPSAIAAQERAQPPSSLRVLTLAAAAPTNLAPPRVNQIHASAMNVLGKCGFSEDGVTFADFESGRIFESGAIIRAGDAAQADLVFKHSRTTVRLEAGTEIRIEKLFITNQHGHPSEHVFLHLRAGRILAVVRSASTGSSLEISNAAGCALVEGNGGGKYIFAADGTHAAAAGSVDPIRLIGEKGATVIAAGQQFTKQDGKLRALTGTSSDRDLTHLNEFQAAIHGPASGSLRPSP